LTGPVSLRIGGDPVHLTTARSFAGSMARVLGLDEGRRHDIRLAVSELVTIAIRSGLSGVTLVVDLDTGAALLRIEANDTLPVVPRDTSDLLKAIDGDIWSIDEPWVIRLGGPSIHE
jgi:hypothetical protein